MDLLHVRGDHHKLGADPLPYAVLALRRDHVRDLDGILPGGIGGFGALRVPVVRSFAAPVAASYCFSRYAMGIIPHTTSCLYMRYGRS